MRADRVKLPAGFLAARARVECSTRTRGPLVVAGRFDRAAIMTVAAAAAKAHQARYGSSWSESMAVSLKAAWLVAKAARRAVAH
jgi:hypothetical protein